MAAPMTRQINFSVDDRVYAALEKHAAKHGAKGATTFAKMLFEAAFASRVSVQPDPSIDEQVGLALVMHAARADTARISEAVRLSEPTVLKIIDAWRRKRLLAAA
jgi:hypothetical protein